MKLPKFIICGAMKSGTTSLHSYLSQHPEIFMPEGRAQETHYFDDPKNYAKGLDWYKDCFKEGKEKQLIGQTSPLYMYLDYVPERIYRLLPEIKLLFILRNPVDRAYSHYWHEWKKNREFKTFERALNLEGKRLESGNFSDLRNYSYFSRGYYFEQISKYLQFFDKGQIKVVIFEELKSDLQKNISECYRFLNVDEHFLPQSMGIENATLLPKFRLLKKILSSNRFSENIGFLNDIDKKYNRKNHYPRLDEGVRQSLEKMYLSDIKNLELLIGKNLKIWYENV